MLVKTGPGGPKATTAGCDKSSHVGNTGWPSYTVCLCTTQAYYQRSKLSSNRLRWSTAFKRLRRDALASRLPL